MMAGYRLGDRMLYKRRRRDGTKSPVWHYEFEWNGKRYRGSTREVKKERARDKALLKLEEVRRGAAEVVQDALLSSLFGARVPLLRKGFWGLNALARLGVYGQTSLHAEIGYRLRENRDDAHG